MDKRSVLKKRARKSLKHGYFKAVFVCFLATLVMRGGYQYITEDIYFPTKNMTGTDITDVASIKVKNDYDSVRYTLGNVLTKKKDLNKFDVNKGVFTFLRNEIKSTESFVFGCLKSLNAIIFNNSISSIFILFSGIIIYILFYIFVKNIIFVGEKRYFLENKNYKETSFDRLLLPYKVKRTLNVAKVMFMKTLYNFLWFFTIIGGFIKYYSYLMVPYILAENPNVNYKDAIKLSKDMMNGYKWYAFKLDLSFIGWYILSLLTFNLLNIFYVNPYREVVFAEFYFSIRDLTKKNKLNNNELLNDKYLDGYENSISYPKNKFSIPEVTHRKWLKIDYRLDYTIRDIVLFFFIFSIFGWVWEVFISLFEDGMFVNRGTMFGPWLPIYGWGGIAILVLLKPFREKPWLLFIMAVLLCGVLEYGTSLYLECVHHMKWWDYNGYFLNINGRVCLEGLLVFGLGGCGFTYILAPMCYNILKKINVKILNILCIVLISLYFVDFVYSTFNPNTGEGITDYAPYQMEDSKAIK